MNPLFLIGGVPAGYLLGSIATRLEKRYKGKSDFIRAELLALPIEVLATVLILLSLL